MLELIYLAAASLLSAMLAVWLYRVIRNWRDSKFHEVSLPRGRGVPKVRRRQGLQHQQGFARMAASPKPRFEPETVKRENKRPWGW